MGLPRDVFELLGKMESAESLFSPGSKERVCAVPGASSVLGKLNRSFGEERGGDILLLTLQALAVQRGEMKSGFSEAEFVATIPGSAIPGVRQTANVVKGILASARREIIALGYEISDGDFIGWLHETAGRDVDLVLVCDRNVGSGTRIMTGWPPGCRRPDLYQDRERENAAIYSKMHSKTLISDSDEMLVSSANFTFHGLNGNIEFGVRMKGRQVLEARNIIRQMINNGLLEKVPWPS
ncbi:MAG: hypothetical protein KF767_03110 [Bdellovibrionaceae bacterium]|nr:hypothetical protein [Pseudobdellovibrionaceae bacterium]